MDIIHGMHEATKELTAQFFIKPLRASRHAAADILKAIMREYGLQPGPAANLFRSLAPITSISPRRCGSH